MKYRFCKRMLRLGVLIAVCLTLLLRASGQSDLPDNIEVADCVTDVTEQPWTAQVLHFVNDIHCYYVPLVGDIDGDGFVEIVAGKAVTNDHYTTQVGIYRGADLQPIATISVPQKIYAGYAGPMALVRYPDVNGGMQGAIILHCYDRKLRSYDINGNLLATSDVNTPCEGVVSITDFNYDGWPEVYIGNAVYDAATLKRLCQGPSDGNMGRSYRNAGNEAGRSAMPFAANVLGDSIPELICGNTIYNVDLISRTDTSLNHVTEAKTVTIPTNVPQDGNVAVADFNKDGQLDVLVIIDKSNSETYDTAYICAYNPMTEDILFVHSHYARTIGFPLVGDIDGDSDLDIVYIDYQSQVSNSRITAITYNTTDSLQPKWQATHSDQSGQTSMTLFDFNQDDIMEIVYRDESNLRIINGSGKSHLTGNDTIPFYNLYTKSMSAGTWKEYPVVADVNGDGAAEIVVCGKVGSGLGYIGGQLWVVGGVHPWAPARPVWNQYMYNVTNINKDLTVPIPLFDNATVFTDPQGVVRRPFNNFLQQATTLDQYGKPFSRMMNVTTTTDVSRTHEDGFFTFTFTFCNDGGSPLNEPFSITYYANEYGGPIVRMEEIYTSLTVGNCLTVTTQFTDEELLAFPDINTIVVAVNDNGNGVAQTGGQQEECDTTDNFFSFLAIPCNIPTDTVMADVCLHESYSDENFDITDSVIPSPGTYFFERKLVVGECDSVIVLKLQVHPKFDVWFSETIPEGMDYDRHGLFLSESDLEESGEIDTSVVLQSVYGCDSVMHVSVVVTYADVNLYLPNVITPSKSDGLNDVFFLPQRYQKFMGDFEIMIFNRWGEMVFYSTDKAFQWGGEYKGKTFYDNVYQYIIHYTNQVGKWFTLKGTITVL